MGILTAITAASALAGIAQSDDSSRRQKHAAERQAELIAEEAKRTQEAAVQAAQAAQNQQAQLQAQERAAEALRTMDGKAAKEAEVVVDVGAPGAGETTAKRRAKFQVADTPDTSVRI